MLFIVGALGGTEGSEHVGAVVVGEFAAHRITPISASTSLSDCSA